MRRTPLAVTLTLTLAVVMGCSTGALDGLSAEDTDRRCGGGQIYDDTQNTCVSTSF